MESLGAVMIEGEDYEVVDECMEEEDSSNTAQVKPVENSMDTAENEKAVSAKDATEEETTTVPDDSAKDSCQSLNDEAKDDAKVDNQCSQKPNIESSDFGGNTSSEQVDEQKDMTDEDVLQNLDEIENIVLDPATFQMQGENDQVSENKAVSIKKEVVEMMEVDENLIQDQTSSSNEGTKLIKEKIKEVKPEICEWYEKKLAEKEATIKERLSKLARVLGFSYPSYEKWLEWVEKTNGSPVCKLEPSRRCRLDKPYTNRWKFICSRKSVQESTKKTGEADTSVNKNIETVWRLEATGAWGVNTNNESEFPPFVLRAVKIFEDFLQTTEQSTNQESVTMTENFTDDISVDCDSKREPNNDAKQQWLWLLVRCNSMDELMLFATGKNISRPTMDRLKQVYESGPGKDCNVKSLYCKSMNKCDDTTVTNTTFLVGSEALDELVGGIKVQLAPKTNFWSNAAGAENVAKAVVDLLAPTPKITVLEIGCGIGLIGLMMASKCQTVIGVDSQSEVEEAEMTCELNNIKNAKFIMGSPGEVTNQIITAVKNRKTFAVINANTNIGRAIEVMTCLRKITTLKRIAMVTTLTKQSVRAILELARPMDRTYGNPFVPIRACVVDTLPVGPHFEVVILMERRLMHKYNQQWYLKVMDENAKSGEAKSEQEKTEEEGYNSTEKGATVKGFDTKVNKNIDKTGTKQPMRKKGKAPMQKKMFGQKNTDNLSMKGKFKGKRPYSPDKSEMPLKKIQKHFDKFSLRPWRTDLGGKKKKEWTTDNPQLHINSMYEKKLRENKEQADLRERLSTSRIDTEIAQKVKEHQALLEIAKEKLSGPAPTVDVSTAKQLQSMLNMVLEQTNKLQSQLPRSVWDRIAPPEAGNHSTPRKDELNDLLLKNRYVQEMGTQDLLITTKNKNFLNEEPAPKPVYRKYNNIPPLEPNTIMPVGPAIPKRETETFQKSADRYHEPDFRRQQQTQANSWNRDKTFDKNRWNEPPSMRKPVSPVRRQVSPMKHRISPPRRFSPKRPLLCPPRRSTSPPRRYCSPIPKPPSPFRIRTSPSSYRTRTTTSPTRPTTPTRRPLPSVSVRMMSPSRREMVPPRRPVTPPRRLADEWDIPSRGAVEQSTWSRPMDGTSDSTWRKDKPSTSSASWEQGSSNDRYHKTLGQDKWDAKDSVRDTPWNTGGNSWNTKQMPKPMTNDNKWSVDSTFRWPGTSNAGSSGENWSIHGKETFSSREDNWTENNKQNRWESSNQKDSWNQGNKEDWNDLPEDAIDPWGDGEGNFGFFERWLTMDNSSSSSTWYREVADGSWINENSWVRQFRDGDPWFDEVLAHRKQWLRQKDSLQNKSQSVGSKPQWQNETQSAGESRWMPQNDLAKKGPSSTWQSESSVGSWQPQSFNFQSQRPYSTTQYRDLH